MYAFLGFLLGLGLSYVIFPFPSTASGDDKGLERFIIAACITALGFGLEKLLQATGAQSPKAPPQSPPKSPALTSDDTKKPAPHVAQEIRALAELRDDGILTNEEFEKQKRQILDR